MYLSLSKYILENMLLCFPFLVKYWFVRKADPQETAPEIKIVITTPGRDGHNQALRNSFCCSGRDSVFSDLLMGRDRGWEKIGHRIQTGHGIGSWAIRTIEGCNHIWLVLAWEHIEKTATNILIKNLRELGHTQLVKMVCWSRGV